MFFYINFGLSKYLENCLVKQKASNEGVEGKDLRLVSNRTLLRTK